MSTSRFDTEAATWDEDPEKVARAALIAREIAGTGDLDPSARFLEYGAGTGLLTQALLAGGDLTAASQVTLADNSEGMRQVMAAKVESGALAGATVSDLDLEVDHGPQDAFDAIATVLVMHHVHALPTVLAAFARLLTPGGRLFIADLDAEDGSFHGEGFDGHHGFHRAQLESDLRDAGFASVTIADCTELTRHDGTYSVFLANAQR